MQQNNQGHLLESTIEFLETQNVKPNKCILKPIVNSKKEKIVKDLSSKIEKTREITNDLECSIKEKNNTIKTKTREIVWL